jgi:hypothetical protein
MLACADRLDRPFGVACVRHGDVDGVDLAILQQRLVAFDDAGAGEILGKAGLVGIAGGDGASLPVRECAMPSAKVRAMVPGPIMPQRIGWSELMGDVLFLASVLGLVSISAGVFRRCRTGSCAGLRARR